MYLTENSDILMLHMKVQSKFKLRCEGRSFFMKKRKAQPHAAITNNQTPVESLPNPESEYKRSKHKEVTAPKLEQ